MLPEEIPTRRLLLRPFRVTDADDVFGYASDAEWRRFLPVPDPYTRHDAQAFIDMTVRSDPNVRQHWAISRDGKAIGGVNMRFFDERRIAEVGYSIAHDSWGRGYAAEAVTALIDAAFGMLPMLIRVRAFADARNARSIRVMEKAGMSREGVHRSNRFLRGKPIDELCYAILRDEWGAPRE